MYQHQAVAVQQQVQMQVQVQRGGNWPGSPHMPAHRPAYSPALSPAGMGGGGRGGIGPGGGGGYFQPRSPGEASTSTAGAALGDYRPGPPSPASITSSSAAAAAAATGARRGDQGDLENSAGFGTRRLAKKMAEQAESKAREAWELREYERQLAQYEEEKRRYEEESRRYEVEKRRYEEEERRYVEEQRRAAAAVVVNDGEEEDMTRRRRRYDEERERERRAEARQEQARAEEEEKGRRRRREEEKKAAAEEQDRMRRLQEQQQEEQRRRDEEQHQQEAAAARTERQALVERQRSAARMRDEAEQRKSPIPPSRSPVSRSDTRSPFHHHDRSQTSVATTTSSGSGGSMRSILRGVAASSANAASFEKRPDAPSRSTTLDSSSSSCVGLAYDRGSSRAPSVVSRQDSIHQNGDVGQTTPRVGSSSSSDASAGRQGQAWTQAQQQQRMEAQPQPPQIQLRRPSAVGLGIEAANQQLPASIRETMYDDDFEEGEEEEGGLTADATLRNRYTQYGGQLDADADADVDAYGDTSRASTLLAAPAPADAIAGGGGPSGRSHGRRSMALSTVIEPSPMAKCADCGHNIAFELLADHACAATSEAPPVLSPSTAPRSPFFDKYAAVHANGRSLAKTVAPTAMTSETTKTSPSSFAASRSNTLDPASSGVGGMPFNQNRPRHLDLSASPAAAMRSPPVRAFTSPMLSPSLTSGPLPPDAASERRKYIEKQREAAKRGQLTPKVPSPAAPSSPLPPTLRVDTSVGGSMHNQQQRSPLSATPISASSRLGARLQTTAEASSPPPPKHYEAMSRTSSSASSAHSSLLGPSSGQRRRGHTVGGPGGGGNVADTGGLRSPSSAALTPSSSYDVLSEGEATSSSSCHSSSAVEALQNKSKVMTSAAKASGASLKPSMAQAPIVVAPPPKRRGSSDSDASSEADLDKLQDLLTDLESSARARAESRASSNANAYRSRSHSSAAGSIAGSRSGSHSGSSRAGGSHSGGSHSGSISSSTHSRSMSGASDATSQPLTVRGAMGAAVTAAAGVATTSTSTSTSRRPSPSKSRERPNPLAATSSKPPMTKASSAPRSPIKPISPSRPVAPVKLCCVCLRSLTSSKLPFVSRDGKFFCSDDYADLYLPKCRKCRKPVEKNAVKSSDGALTGVFHRECFRCFKCDDDFLADGSTFYCFENAPYCSTHYHELAGSVCKGCNQGIEGRCRQTEKGDKWHPHCLRCQFEGQGEFCQEALDDFYVMEGKRLCEWHARKTQKALESEGRGKFKPSKRSTKLFNV